MATKETADDNNVRVAVRCRPLSSKETGRREKSIFEVRCRGRVARIERAQSGSTCRCARGLPLWRRHGGAYTAAMALTGVRGCTSTTALPCVPAVTERAATCHVQITDGHIVIGGAPKSGSVGKNKFAFDFMYGPDSTQEQVWIQAVP